MKLPVSQIVEQGHDEVVLRLSVGHNCEAFAGHFPDRPVLPGVVQLDWAMRLADQYVGLGAVFAQDVQIKFRKIIEPETELLLSLKLDRTKKKLSFTYCVENDIMSSGHIKLGEA